MIDDPLEQTQDFMPLPPGVWRRTTDEDTLIADLEDGMRSYTRAPELSETLSSRDYYAACERAFWQSVTVVK